MPRPRHALGLAFLLAACDASPTPPGATPDAALTDLGKSTDRPDAPDVPAPDVPAPDVPAPDVPAPDVPAPDAGPPGCLSLRGAALLPGPGRELGPHTAQSLAYDAARGALVLAPATRPGPFVEDRPLPRGALDADGFVMDGWWYLLGGQTDATHTSTELLSAPVQPDGTLGQWSARTPYPLALLDHITLAHAGRVYLTGGAQDLGGDNVRQLVAARFGSPAAGDIPRWTDAPDNPVRRFGHEAVLAAGFLYTLGGDDGDRATDDVSVATVLPDGSLAPWRRTSPLPDGVNQFLAGAGTSRHLWALGGCRRKDCETVSNIERRMFVADIQTDGALSPWRLAGMLPLANYDQKAVVTGGRVVMVGGRAGGRSRCGDAGGDNYDGVWWAELLPDGALGPWESGASMGVVLPRVRSDQVMRVDHLGQLWVLGGRTSCIGAETADRNNNFPREVWRSAAVALPGRARVGHWLSGPLAVASGRATSLRWDVDGEVTVQVRFERDAAPDTWNAWTIAPTSARSMPLGDGVRRVQVLATFSGDGAGTPALRSVTLDCAP
ncbi:MAG: hypothetical protein Q8S73_14180 [Deltaproteobacteria bacterium]|nr:hypothetical protein [Myxococcales bacterium]MDP3215250.1 hypothetical protein [Deltaproteobacteria bacterium]